MARYTIEEPPISIVYGYDHTGVFLSVYDDRLKHKSNATDEINKAFEYHVLEGLRSGNGCYLDLHTGDTGVGLQASWPVMSEYLKRYGIPRERMTELLKQHLARTKQQSAQSTQPSAQSTQPSAQSTQPSAQSTQPSAQSTQDSAKPT